MPKLESFGRRLAAEVGELEGDVGELEPQAGGQEQIRRLDVAVHDGTATC